LFSLAFVFPVFHKKNKASAKTIALDKSSICGYGKAPQFPKNKQ